MDFIVDPLSSGQRFLALIIIDIFTREALAIDMGQRWGASDVVCVLDEPRVNRGASCHATAHDAMHAGTRMGSRRQGAHGTMAGLV
ncbi:hypothetical protein AQ611_10240 [Burkholderia singularis]|nr:hypothetical protein AQ611_10240 [Burkholderia sp. Bp7605]